MMSLLPLLAPAAGALVVQPPEVAKDGAEERRPGDSNFELIWRVELRVQEFEHLMERQNSGHHPC